MPPLEREPLDPELEAFVEKRRQEPGPTPADKERLYARLATTLALPGGPSSPSDPGPAGADGAGSGGAHTGLSGTALKAAVAVVAVAVVAIGTYSVLRRPGGGRGPHEVVAAPALDARPGTGGKTPSSSKAPEPSPSKERETVAPSQLEQPAVPARPPRHRRPAAARRASSLTSSLAAERALLERARAALSRRQAAEASRELKEHQRKFPRGKLAQERDALLVLCLVRLGEHEAAHTAGARFRKRHPNSIMLPVVLDALKEAHKTTPPGPHAP